MEDDKNSHWPTQYTNCSVILKIGKPFILMLNHLYLNFSIETKIKTLFQILYFKKNEMALWVHGLRSKICKQNFFE